MIIYSVTISIENDIAQDWLKWMKEVHIPDVMRTGKFVKQNIFKLISVAEEQNTYNIQYTCETIEDYNDYEKNFAPKLQEEHKARFKDKFVAIRTLLESI
ncbi:MAG: hypothetical protein COB85_09215 [Bacteroidetes bacterium]|nr:MAG: hypothetical protein COB85_09215 [Bacteroidota bacterium]